MEITYVPSLSEYARAAAQTGGGSSGHGSPEGVATASPGATYTDVDSADFYTKQAGTGNTGWVKVTGAAGGGGLDVKFGAFLDPNNNVTGNPDDIYKSVESLGGDGSTWLKQTGSGNTGWV